MSRKIDSKRSPTPKQERRNPLFGSWQHNADDPGESEPFIFYGYDHAVRVRADWEPVVCSYGGEIDFVPGGWKRKKHPGAP